jgi:hypothetical protein
MVRQRVHDGARLVAPAEQAQPPGLNHGSPAQFSDGRSRGAAGRAVSFDEQQSIPQQVITVIW